MQTNRMRTNNAPGLTAELNRKVGAETVPHGVRRRASANATQQTEPIQARTKPKKRQRGLPTPFLLLVGFLVGLILIMLGFQVMTWTNEVMAHWHGGDGYVTAQDTDVGHGGTSHFLAFYQSETIVVVEFSSDYSTAHSYTIKLVALGTDHPRVTLSVQVTDGRRDLMIHLDDGINSILYNTGDGFRLTPTS